MTDPTRAATVKKETALSEREADVFVLMWEDGYTEGDVARELDMAVGTVRSHKARIRNKIREATALLNYVEGDP